MDYFLFFGQVHQTMNTARPATARLSTMSIHVPDNMFSWFAATAARFA